MSDEEVISEDEQALATAIWGALAHMGSLPSAVDVATAVLCQRLVTASCRARRGRDVPLRGLRLLEHAASCMRLYGIEVSGGVDGVANYLCTLPYAVQRAAAAQVLLAVIREEQTTRTVLSELPLRDWLQLTSNGGDPEPTRGGHTCIPDAARAADVVLLRTAASHIGLSFDRALSLAKGLELTVSRLPSRRRTFTVIPVAQVDQLRCAATNVPDDSLEQLGLTHQRKIVRLLRLAELLGAPGDESTASRTRKLVGQLRSLSSRHSLSSDFNISLGSPLLYRHIHHLAVRELFADIFAGRIPIQRERPGGSLTALKIDLAQVQRLRRRSIELRRPKPGQNGACQLSLFRAE